MYTPVRNKDSNTLAGLYESTVVKKKVIAENAPPFAELEGLGGKENNKFEPGKAMSDPKYGPDSNYKEYRLVGKEARQAIYDIGKLLLAKLKGEKDATFPGDRSAFQKYVSDLVVNNLKDKKTGKALFKPSFAIHIARNIIGELENHKVIHEFGVERKVKAAVTENKPLVDAVNKIEKPEMVFTNTASKDFDYGVPKEEPKAEAQPESKPAAPAIKPQTPAKKKIKAPA